MGLSCCAVSQFARAGLGAAPCLLQLSFIEADAQSWCSSNRTHVEVIGVVVLRFSLGPSYGVLPARYPTALGGVIVVVVGSGRSG